MKKVKTEKCKTSKVNIIVRRDLKKVMSYRIKIFRIPFNYSEFNEIKIEEMQDQKSEDNSSRPDHKP
jgi:hypothetical protein